MSRIPKIGSGCAVENKKLTQYKSDSALRKNEITVKSGFKRPSDDFLPHVEKKQKMDAVSTLKKRTLNAVQPSNSKSVATFEGSKRVALQPIPDNGVRCSMPAVVSTAKLKIPGKPKRPAWDLKGRIQDMEEHFQTTQLRNATLQEELRTYNERIAALESANTLLHQDVEQKSVQSEEASSKVQELENRLKQMREEHEFSTKEKEREIESLKKELSMANQELATLRNEYENLKNTYQQETTVLKSSISSLTCMKAGIQAQLDATELMLENQRAEIKQLKNECAAKDSQIACLMEQVSTLESEIRNGESMRRKLHNSVLELKGNIRVFCRLRPPLPEELKNGMTLANVVAVNEKSIEIQQLTDANSSESGAKVQPKYEFSFDYFFPSSSTQEEIFNEISQLVQSSLDGYNVCIFAYGQTGSGKTFTMEGPSDIIDFVANFDNPQLGMIPRSVQQIFSTISNLEGKGWKYKVEALFLEIYNERIQDLLNSQRDNKCEIIKSGSKGIDCIISNVTTSEVTSAKQVYALMKKARINRAVAATKCNEYSSRSHYVFQMKICGENSITTEKCDGTLNLVDLAGSERVKESESVGNRLTEAKAINKSLSNLGKVIMSLSKKESHISYRDSKLTHLLANSLGGNSKTLMFVNISPDNKNLSETINSLRFATQVNQCNIGTAQKRVK